MGRSHGQLERGVGVVALYGVLRHASRVSFFSSFLIALLELKLKQLHLCMQDCIPPLGQFPSIMDVGTRRLLSIHSFIHAIHPTR